VQDVVLRYDGFITKLYADTSLQVIQKGEKLASLYSPEISKIQEELQVASKLNANLASSLRAKLKLLGVTNLASQRLDEVDIYAPQSGILLQKKINQGAFVKTGSLLFQIADLSKLWVIAKIYQRDRAFVTLGMEATIAIEGFGNHKAKVEYIYPVLDKTSKTIDVRLSIDNPKSFIYPNLFATITLYKEHKTMLTLPRSALFTKGSKHYIFKPIDAKSFTPVEVQARRIDAYKFEILSGVQKGEKVIDRVMFMLDSDAITNGLYDDEEW